MEERRKYEIAEARLNLLSYNFGFYLGIIITVIGIIILFIEVVSGGILLIIGSFIVLALRPMRSSARKDLKDLLS